jgi:hypothetical protein
MSSGVPARPIGICIMSIPRTISLSSSPFVMFVSMKPGPIAFSRTPDGARFRAHDFVNIHTPAFETP